MENFAPPKAPPEAKNRTNRPLYLLGELLVRIYFHLYVFTVFMILLLLFLLVQLPSQIISLRPNISNSFICYVKRNKHFNRLTEIYSTECILHTNKIPLPHIVYPDVHQRLLIWQDQWHNCSSQFHAMTYIHSLPKYVKHTISLHHVQQYKQPQ